MPDLLEYYIRCVPKNVLVWYFLMMGVTTLVGMLAPKITYIIFNQAVYTKSLRLMIARAVAPKPNILIFDEASSALDNLTQKKIAQALDSLKCTRIVIAHRLSTIRQCDRIIVLDGGKIIEDGTYQELIDKKGFFAELVERQRVDV